MEKPKPTVVRKRHNQNLIRKMRSGEPLWSFDSSASWFPPRPIIAKDKRAVARLYGSTAQPLVQDANASAIVAGPTGSENEVNTAELAPVMPLRTLRAADESSNTEEDKSAS